jgi:hypothetical protein
VDDNGHKVAVVHDSLVEVGDVPCHPHDRLVLQFVRGASVYTADATVGVQGVIPVLNFADMCQRHGVYSMDMLHVHGGVDVKLRGSGYQRCMWLQPVMTSHCIHDLLVI